MITATSLKTWDVISLLERASEHLKSNGFDEARLNVELLLAHVLHLHRIELYTNFDRPVTDAELSEFKLLFKRRLGHEPIQYILGETEFMGLPLYVNRNVLIPRPETELLVERAVEVIRGTTPGEVEVLDIGTGSGNISLAIAVMVPSARVTAIEVSPQALDVARCNAERNEIRDVEFIHADMLEDFLPDRTFNLIVANPPYISLEEFQGLQEEVRDFEPRLATTDEGDGFRFIRRIVSVAAAKLRSGGFLLMEIAYNQATMAAQILESAGLVDVQLRKDYAGIDRIIEARHP